MKVLLDGLWFLSETKEDALDIVYNKISDDKKTVVMTPNAEIIMHSKKDKEFFEALESADILLPDGAGVIKASHIMKTPIKEKVAGVDIAMGLLKKLDESKKSLYLLGALEEYVCKAAENIKKKYPNITVNYANGYFKEDSEALNKIVKSDVYFICLGFPKQEMFVYRNKDALPNGLYLCLGGVIDILAGAKKRAPKFFIDNNLEWFYRLLKEPKRIGRMMSLPKYILLKKKEIKKTKGQ